MKITVPVEINIDITLEQVCKLASIENILKHMGEKNKENFEKAEYFVEATQEEITYLWIKYKDKGFPDTDVCSFDTHIGYLVDSPIFILLKYIEINGKIICFYDMIGDYAIWPLADEFLKLAAPQKPKTYSSTFSAAWRHINENKPAA